MKLLLILVLFITLSCSKAQKEESITNEIQWSTIDLDTLMLKEFILKNDRLLDLFTIELQDTQKAELINKTVKSDSNRLKLYNASKFKVRHDKRCNGYRHLIISKQRNQKGVDLEPYHGLFYLIIHPNNKVVCTQKLEEKSLTMGITSFEEQTNWNLTKDSTLTINSSATLCSDDLLEGKATTCWTDKIYAQFKLRCSELQLIKKDSVRTEGNE
ncbi:MAG: hypothetical protein HOP30_17755 [Cyclobacteriaceae bacterium]|nr:hypothetical protein [Cyclobacteriaceae bacterium]